LFRVAERHYSKIVFRARKDDDVEDDDDDSDTEFDLKDQDWRAFRAKLFMGEGLPSGKSDSSSSSSSKSSRTKTATPDEDDLDGIGTVFADSLATDPDAQNMTPLDPSQWAYDSGKMIEQGAIILGGVEQEYGFGLRQQYFHKAAILVLDHQESSFTKGIILNRPSDLTLDDELNPGVKWRVWNGGDVQGLNSMNPDIVCLHSLQNTQVSKASVPIMKDMQWTTFDNAKRLVQAGAAKPTDFWVFCGYAGWGPGQLMGELDRKSWYMVATDSQTLLKELARQSAGADPRDAGLETWTLLMNMIGRGETAEEYSGHFDDMMLKEWARKNLLSAEAGGGAGDKQRAQDGVASTRELMQAEPIDRLIDRVSAAARGEDVTAGSLVRASSAERSPFLLDNQELHKSLVLILSDDDNISLGVMLNRPSSKGLDISITEKDSGKSRTVSLPLRFGGQYAVKGSEPLLWLHSNRVLRAAKVGSPVGMDEGGIWKCSSNDVTAAVGKGLANIEEFMVVSGVSIWTKGEKGLARGIQGEIRAERFEVVPQSQAAAIWSELSKQEVLTPTNMISSLAIADRAWQYGAVKNNVSSKTKSDKMPISGLGEGFDEEDDSLVFKSDVRVSQLSDDALRSWVATFLLNTPSLGA
jgi:putative AlgH/UPF0301 family transcriptional regulator